MNANNNLSDKIIVFIAGEVCINANKLSMKTNLRSLGIDGDDAIKFMSKFRQEFNVDMDKFYFKKYFGNEGFNPFLVLSLSWWRHKFQPITISDLVRAAESGSWPLE